MEVDYNMLSKTNHLMGWWCKVKDLTPQCEGKEFKSPHLQPRLPWLLR